ncbi:NAD(P)-dependent oxidoreductase [Streptococcus sp. sy018]|uniref:NAD(P)-dependent oxidoreductase n=1 Tax=Streptococcus sp. sy018 TaxID=2600147 RepID=UPI0011B83277|nr:NAD(P)-dependent oxidoreductase [Streptococcus sp. sy018]TWS95241.1 lactate dehydrogenase [Streptococcus sp. sy018]
MKIVCYGVRPIEEPYFHQLNRYNFELKLVSDFLSPANVTEAKGCDAVLVRGMCQCDAATLKPIADYGIKYLFTRSVGYNHIDMDLAKALKLMVARVPNYSPYAVAELALTLALQLFRHTNLATTQVAQGDFKVYPSLFSKELHRSTVGIVGMGKIGATEASLYKGLGAKVLGYDPYPSDMAKQFADFVELDELLAQSDIVSLHVPYFPGENDQMVDANFLGKMKKSAILINTARGELIDHEALLAALDSGQLESYGTDVVIDEPNTMGQVFPDISEIPDPINQELLKRYPRVLITPHMGAYTEPALEDMISISFQNFHEAFTTGQTENQII